MMIMSAFLLKQWRIIACAVLSFMLVGCSAEFWRAYNRSMKKVNFVNNSYSNYSNTNSYNGYAASYAAPSSTYTNYNTYGSSTYVSKAPWQVDPLSLSERQEIGAVQDPYFQQQLRQADRDRRGARAAALSAVVEERVGSSYNYSSGASYVTCDSCGGSGTKGRTNRYSSDYYHVSSCGICGGSGKISKSESEARMRTGMYGR